MRPSALPLFIRMRPRALAPVCAAGLLAWLPSVAAAAGDLFEAMGQVCEVGENPNAIAGGDVDGDGHADLVVFNAGSGTMSVLKGRGDGRFDVAPEVPIPWARAGFQLADLDDDGVLDLVVASGAPRRGICVAPGRGDGSFGDPYLLALAEDPAQVVVSDLDGDHRPDLVARLRSAIVLFRQRRDRAWEGSHTLYDGAVGPIAIGDLDHDARPDLVLSIPQATTPVPGPNRLAFLLQAPHGELRMVDTRPVNWRIDGIAIADMDGDSWSDVVVSHGTGIGEGPGPVAVYRGTPSGVPGPAVLLGDYRPLGATAALLTTDLNHDGRTDLVFFPVGFVLINRGSLEFEMGSFPYLGSRPPMGVLVDADEDGTPDLAVSDPGPDGGAPECLAKPGHTVAILRGRGDGSFGRPLDGLGGSHRLYDAGVTDFDGDRLLDLISLDGTVTPNAPFLRVFRGLGDGRFELTDSRFTTASAIMAVGDVTGNGQREILVTTRDPRYYDGIHVWRPDSAGRLEEVGSLDPGVIPYALAIADFDGDGHPDLAVTSPGSYSPATVTVCRKDAAGVLTPAVTRAAPPYPGLLASGDFNGDGLSDLAVASIASSFRPRVDVLFGSRDSLLTDPRTVVDRQWSTGLLAADFDRDGVDDLTFIVPHGPDYCTDGGGTVVVIEGGADFPLTPDHVSGVEYINGALAAGDWDSDGHLDLAVKENRVGIRLLMGRGGFGLERGALLLAGGPYGVLLGADFNDDGRPDLIASRSSNLQFLRNTGPFPDSEVRLEARMAGRDCPGASIALATSTLHLWVADPPAGSAFPLDPASVRLEGVAPVSWRAAANVPFALAPADDPCECHPGPRRAWPALGLEFDTARLAAAAGPTMDGVDRVWTLTARLRDGRAAQGRVCLAAAGAGRGVAATASPAFAAGLDAARPPGPALRLAPNPASVGAAATAWLAVPADDTPVRIEVFDLAGRRVATPREEVLPAGWHARDLAVLAGRAGTGGLPPGLYFVRARIGPASRGARWIVLH